MMTALPGDDESVGGGASFMRAEANNKAWT